MYFDRRSHSGRYRSPPETAGEVQESDLRRESVSKRIDGSVGGRPYEIDQPPEEGLSAEFPNSSQNVVGSGQWIDGIRSWRTGWVRCARFHSVKNVQVHGRVQSLTVIVQVDYP